MVSSVIARLFFVGCGEKLPKEITSHENFKDCQQIEKNYLLFKAVLKKMKKKIRLEKDFTNIARMDYLLMMKFLKAF